MEQIEAWAKEAPKGKARMWEIGGDSGATGYTVWLRQYIAGVVGGWDQTEVSCRGYGKTVDAAFADAKSEFAARKAERETVGS